MDRDIKVSVICNAYNQADYIRNALEGFVMQETDFSYEILVHDDASTDGTADIIREFAEKYPDILKPIYQTENKYSQNISINKTYQYSRAVGKYFAICEGDDYWTDPHKLQKQYEAMEAHPEVDMCAHRAIQLNARTFEETAIAPRDCEGIIPVEDVIFGGGGYFATNSLMFRRELVEFYPPFKKFHSIDYTLQIHGSLRGGIYYLNECMSVYRYMAKGSWTVSVFSDVSRQKSIYEKLFKMLDILDEYTEYKYTDVIRKRKLFDEFCYYRDTDRYKECFKPRFKEVRAETPKKELFKMWFKQYMLGFVMLKRKLKTKK